MRDLNNRAASQGAFEGSDIALDVGRIAGCSAKDPTEPGKAGVHGSIPWRSTNLTSQQFADRLLQKWQEQRAQRIPPEQRKLDEYDETLKAVAKEMSAWLR